MRTGFGYDVHRLIEGRRLILGGVEVPFEKGLLGHSDADVLLHAVIDALIGAAGLGDIGRHFPPSEAAYKNISSIELLSRTMALLKEKKFKVSNIDSTIVCESPRLSPYITDMARNISTVAGCPVDRVNVKAKTEEGLGFTGSGEGIAAYATVLIEEL
ncbi:MAG: 2-C-methyl-D-erythritol 2,4-cyclodiphosphate synthase [Deltaproteobacteria bacterium]|nr:2-C-methyl-D-erythritol 2,4-cyclodiphosphate synthase [Deltaproteobacteria bacterium]